MNYISSRVVGSFISNAMKMDICEFKNTLLTMNDISLLVFYSKVT